MDFAFSLDAASAQPLHRQLYDELRRSILRGRLSPGQRLPSTRTLASTLGLSRATVMQTFAQLLSEGYLDAQQGSGTFVSAALPDEISSVVPVAENDALEWNSVSLSAYGERLLAGPVLNGIVPPETIDAREGHPAFAEFPVDIWRRLLVRHCRADPAVLDLRDPAGYRPLREAIAGYLARTRALHVAAEQIVIVAGTQQALDLAGRLLIDPDDAVAIENPGYAGARRTFAAHGARLIPIPVDDEGMVVEQLYAHEWDEIKLAYVTPSHQFPTGAVLPLHRRIDLLRWARRAQATIVEDDYAGAFRYGERPIPALQGLDEASSVVHVGTFSDVLFPALRIGYVVLPESLVDVFVLARAAFDGGSPLLEQIALTDFIEAGHLERHLRRMRVLYARRRAVLVRELENAFGPQITIGGDRAGMHVFVRLASELDDADVVRHAARAGVAITAVQSLQLGGGPKGAFLIGFAALEEARIAEAVRRLAGALGL